MKSYPSKILYDINKLNQKIVPILFYGNEEGLISVATEDVTESSGPTEVVLNSHNKIPYWNFLIKMKKWIILL